MKTPVFDFREPYKSTKKTVILQDKVNELGPEYYERYTVIRTEHGFVKIDQMHWSTNSGPQIFSYLRTVIGGVCYSAFVDEARLSTSRMDFLANEFMRIIKKAYNR